jgi:hypothetical protein
MNRIFRIEVYPGHPVNPAVKKGLPLHTMRVNEQFFIPRWCLAEA